MKIPDKIHTVLRRMCCRVFLIFLAGVIAVPPPEARSQEKPEPEADSTDSDVRGEATRRKVKETIAAFFKLALIGSADEASNLAADPEKGFNFAKDVEKTLANEPIEIASIQLNAEGDGAFAISKLVTLFEPNPDDRVIGVLAIALVKSKDLKRRGWLIHDIDLGSREDAQAKSQRFLKPQTAVPKPDK